MRPSAQPRFKVVFESLWNSILQLSKLQISKEYIIPLVGFAFPASAEK